MTRKRLVYWPALVVAALTVGPPAFAAPTFTQKDLSQVGWSVTYGGSTYDADSNTTTLTYIMTAASWEKDLSHWVLALDDAPLSSTGCDNTKFGLDPTTGVSGWKCDDGQDAGTTWTYTLTFSGHLGESTTDYSVKGGTYFAVGQTSGPGGPIIDVTTYSISGVTFVDANANGMHDADEPVLSNVLVTLDDGQSMRTDASGHYVFEHLLPGDYAVAVPASSPSVSDDFNESLAQYFTATTPSQVGVHVGPDATDQNFGFGVNTDAILYDFDPADPDGDGFSFSGTGKTIGFWKHQITSAAKGKTKGVQVSAETIRDYLYSGTTSVKTLYIDVFSDIPAEVPGAYDYALAILSSTSSHEVDLLKKQLFGTEMNQQAGLGINDVQLQGILIAWSEYLVKNATLYSRYELLLAKDICDLINNSGE